MEARSGGVGTFDPALSLAMDTWVLFEDAERSPGFIPVCAHCQRSIMGKVFYDDKHRPFDDFCWGLRYSLGIEVPGEGRRNGQSRARGDGSAD